MSVKISGGKCAAPGDEARGWCRRRILPRSAFFTFFNVIKRLWQQLRQAGARDLNNPGLAESLGLDGVMIALGSLVIFLDDRQIIVPGLLIGDGEPLPSQAADFPFKNVFGVGLDMVAREVIVAFALWRKCPRFTLSK
jgi:hypothetical protein